MAKSQFTLFMNDFRGRVVSVVHSFQKGVNYTKPHNATPNNPQTARQTQVRVFMSDLSHNWLSLTDPQKSLWQAYSKMVSSKMNSQTGYIKLNLNLLCASHVDLVTIDVPPTFPATPAFARGLSVFGISNTLFCVSWTHPLTSDDYISVYFRLHSGFCLRFPDHGACANGGYRPSKRFIETVRSDQGPVTFNHSWPSGARIYFKVFSIDKFGRKSPWSHEIRHLVPDPPL